MRRTNKRSSERVVDGNTSWERELAHWRDKSRSRAERESVERGPFELYLQFAPGIPNLESELRLVGDLGMLQRPQVRVRETTSVVEVIHWHSDCVLPFHRT